LRGKVAQRDSADDADYQHHTEQAAGTERR